MKIFKPLLTVLLLSPFIIWAQPSVVKQILTTTTVNQYRKTEFDITVSSVFNNPYDARRVAVDMILTSPSHKKMVLPCYYVASEANTSSWQARFAPQEAGVYTYAFQVSTAGKIKSTSKKQTFKAAAATGDGFLHINDYWTFKFDSGKPFRGIGENVGWEARSFENSKWTFDYLLPTLSQNGANFFRTWMCPWNLPLAWKKVTNTNRYVDTDKYFNESGIKRMDQFIDLADSLHLYMMLSIDYHGALISDGQWKINNYNIINGGHATTPSDFFTDTETKAMYNNKLRYLIARWGYSTSIAAWEFFNEVDNAVFTATPQDSILIPHQYVTAWHDEMSTYLKKHDLYKHIVTTSISHRDITGMNDLPNIDLNQKHIYNRTNQIPGAINEYIARYKKPYVIGEFGYDWNWDNVKHESGPEFDYDYKRGLWYGLFSPTPIVPMTWWWEFFDERNMTPYFKSVRTISDEMMIAGKGEFELVDVKAASLNVMAVHCGDKYFVYVLNNTESDVSDSIILKVGESNFHVKSFTPVTLQYKELNNVTANQSNVTIPDVHLNKGEEIIFILSPLSSSKKVSSK
jgi:hypothetical protein